jgi:hypothetical protein
MQLLEQYSLLPKLHGVFKNGMIYEFLEGRVLTPSDLWEGTYSKDIAKTLASWHRTNISDAFSTTPALWSYSNIWFSQST